MAKKFMKVLAVVIPVVTLVILISQMRGCAMFTQNELVQAIQTGGSVTIELVEPATQIKGSQISKVTWVQLDQLKTYNITFRGSYDNLFNVTPIKDTKGNQSKTGCLYVNKSSERDGNTTLQDAFRNKVFIEKYWGSVSTKTSMSQLAKTIYVDVESSDVGTLAAINGYYNLINDHMNPDSFNATKSISREEFYTLLFKATNPVREIKAGDKFSRAVGGETQYTKYAAQVENLGFLQTSNKSLDEETITSSMSRAEAAYMVVNALFPNELNTLTGKEKCYSDAKNAGDLISKLKIQDDQAPWQKYVLAYSVKNPDKGLHDSLYRSLVVAHKLGLFDTAHESRWDEPISKSESLDLIIKAFQAQNSLYGYLTEIENGTVIDNFFDNSPLTTDINDGVVEEIVPADNSFYIQDPITGEIIYVPGGSEPLAPPTENEINPDLSSNEDAIDAIWGTGDNQPQTPPSSKPSTGGGVLELPPDFEQPDGPVVDFEGKPSTTPGGNPFDR